MALKFWVKSCNSCGYDNPDDSRKCNSCFTNFYDGGFFGYDLNSKKITNRWVCNCGRVNLSDNKTCSACFVKR